jgi:hypothetical protein
VTMKMSMPMENIWGVLTSMKECRLFACGFCMIFGMILSISVFSKPCESKNIHRPETKIATV